MGAPRRAAPRRYPWVGVGGGGGVEVSAGQVLGYSAC